MSYDLISKTEPRASKLYCCIWCPEKIAVKEKHIHEISNYEGDFQDLRWHIECYSAAQEYFRNGGEPEIYPHECKRGSQEPV